MVLQDELDELKTSTVLLKQSDDELVMLQNQWGELTKRLSEQVSKVEEFKELKSMADYECHNACGRRGPDGAPAAMQESLRITVIKEQHETKLQELKQQLSLSKTHNEEMMWKLQDAISELENRKKSEASQAKRNEELGMRIMNLEAKLQEMLFEKRDLSNAYNLMKGEKECPVMSLECCKKEKKELSNDLCKFLIKTTKGIMAH